ncbi:MAG: sulfurtransferase TusA family protein [Thermodesulfovibrionales bacterium]|nr:sulfurtransferase TusA family protein [Thermodesulfovibrionales bacterium]
MGDAKYDRSIDIRGLVCPMTFVKAKLAIEDMTPGEMLEIVLDYEEASRSIPKSMKDHDHEVLKVEKVNDTDWVLLIRKGGA